VEDAQAYCAACQHQRRTGSSQVGKPQTHRRKGNDLQHISNSSQQNYQDNLQLQRMLIRCGRPLPSW